MSVPMSSASRVQLAPGVPALESLGVSGPEELLCPGGAPERTGVRVRNAGGDALRGDSPGPRDRAILRFPLPGTPDDEGRLGGRPGEVGTGWVVLSRWHSPSLVALLRSRFTAPRSSSLAEREWNLLCRLLDHGVGVPPPRGGGGRGGPGGGRPCEHRKRDRCFLSLLLLLGLCLVFECFSVPPATLFLNKSPCRRHGFDTLEL